MDVVSIWTEPTSAAVTMVTKSHPTAELVKVCQGLSRAVGCISLLDVQMVKFCRQRHNVYK